jgi:hypothetical protein
MESCGQSFSTFLADFPSYLRTLGAPLGQNRVSETGVSYYRVCEMGPCRLDLGALASFYQLMLPDISRPYRAHNHYTIHYKKCGI